MGNSGLHWQKSWDSVEIFRISPAKTVMCGFDFRQKIGESLGKNLRIFRDIFSSKNTFKKVWGFQHLKKNKNGIWRSHLGGYPVSWSKLPCYIQKKQYHLVVEPGNAKSAIPAWKNIQT